jgi:outer membrane protein
MDLSVEQAVLLALRYNRELAVEQLTPVITGAFEAIERGVFDPELFNRAAKARDLAARASVQQADAAVANLEQLVRLDVRLAVNEAERARRQITASAATRELQEETLRAETARFGVGAGTGLSVAQAQRDLLESRIAEVEAMVQYRLALIDLYLAEGSLLERRGIRLPAGPSPRK